MNKPKYPISAFIVGFFINFFVRHLLLIAGGIILTFVSPQGTFFYNLGLVMIVYDAILSFTIQFNIRKKVMDENTDDPEIKRLQAALAKDGKWTDNMQDIVEGKVSEMGSKNKKMKKLKDYDKHLEEDYCEEK